MSQRQRLTWAGEARRASAAPATPNEGPASPAHQPDPEATKYENGDTSSWAEDVHPGPYPQSAHPATPDEGPASPAYKAAALERKAAKCIRIATAMLGDADGDAAKVAAIEDQALVLMDLNDASIKASLSRLGMDDEEEEEEEEEASKKASDRFAGLESRMARMERILIRLAGEEEEEVEEEVVEEAAKKAAEEEEVEEEVVEEAAKKAADDEASDEDEEAASKAACGDMPMDEEAMLNAMLEEEGMMDMGEAEMAPMSADPMGMGEMAMDADEQMILASIFNKSADDDEEEEVEEEEDEETSKKAAERRPQPKKASAGARKLGGVSKEAGSDVEELSQLWESAPDVSHLF